MRKNRFMKITIVLVLFILLILFDSNFSLIREENEEYIPKTGNLLSLVKPAFALESETSFLEEEAGISLYMKVNQQLDLSKVKSAFKTIEKETSNYIVGSISLPNLPETDDVHCFVQKDGWIVVYYLKDEPISKIIDWSYYSGTTLTKTKLLVVLEKIASVLGTSVTNAKYYHFQYPFAEKFMIIIEKQVSSGTDSFNLSLPSSFSFYEESWSYRGGEGGYYHADYFSIDGKTISSNPDGTKYGTLTTHLSSDTFHTILIDNESGGTQYVAIVLAYKES